MAKVRPWCGQPSDRGRLKNRNRMTSSCWPLRGQNYRSWWIAQTESAANTAYSFNVDKTKVMADSGISGDRGRPPLSPSETGHQTSDQYVQPAMGFPAFSFCFEFSQCPDPGGGPGGRVIASVFFISKTQVDAF